MKFEYKIEGGISEARMNELGAQGWELVSAEVGRFTFKRVKVEPSVPAKELFAPKKK